MPAGFGLVVNERNEILMIQRGYGKEKGLWSLPGGNREGESLRKTAVRETREETGINMTADSLYYKSEHHRFEYGRGNASAAACGCKGKNAWTRSGSRTTCSPTMTIWRLARTKGPLGSGQLRIRVAAGSTIPDPRWAEQASASW